jgi:predicted XRE-type DNA-binding protein
MDSKALERFLDKIKEDEETGCWIWVAGISGSGYPQFWYDGKNCRANRLSYEHYKGTIPTGLYILHRCPGGDNPICVNPDHLRVGDHTENMADRGVNGSQVRGELHPDSLLTESDVLMIRDLYATQRFTQSELALYYGVGQTTVSDLLRRKTWSHI